AFRRGRGAGWLLGVAAGLACLQKYQSGLVWLGLVPAVIADRGGREGARTLATAAIGFALVMAPWWVRNLLAFGDPFYTEIKWNLLCDWGLGGDELRFWARFERPPTLPGYALTHPIDALRVTYGGLRVLLDIGWRDHVASPAMVPLALARVRDLRRRAALRLGDHDRAPALPAERTAVRARPDRGRCGDALRVGTRPQPAAVPRRGHGRDRAAGPRARRRRPRHRALIQGHHDAVECAPVPVRARGGGGRGVGARARAGPIA